MNPSKQEIDLDDEFAAPGGAGVNRAATVVTSAALGGAAAGALVGTVAGPIGTAIGAAVGALAAAAAGNVLADSVDSPAEQSHGSDSYADQRAHASAAWLAHPRSASKPGGASEVRQAELTFSEIEEEISQEWAVAGGWSGLDGSRARRTAGDDGQRISVILVGPRSGI